MIEFNRTHCNRVHDDEMVVNALIQILSIKTVYTLRRRASKAKSILDNTYYLLKPTKVFDLEECIAYIDKSNTKHKEIYKKILADVKEDIEAYPDGVPDTSDEWDKFDFAEQARIMKLASSKRRTRGSYITRAAKQKKFRQRDFLRRWREVYG